MCDVIVRVYGYLGIYIVAKQVSKSWIIHRKVNSRP
jgi:hypothetical protein